MARGIGEDQGALPPFCFGPLPLVRPFFACFGVRFATVVLLSLPPH